MRLLQQIKKKNPFTGDYLPSRVSLFARNRVSLPFPHLWNYREPIRILDAYFQFVEGLDHSQKHNRFLDVPFFPAVLVTRDPAVIKPILLDTGDKAGQFDRDTLPTDGIARATGEDSLLYSNGEQWRMQKKLAAPSFGKTKLFQPEKFAEFEQTFRKTAAERLDVLRQQQSAAGASTTPIELEPEISAIMLEMLVNNFFGGQVSYADIQQRYVPSLTLMIDHMVTDTIAHRIQAPINVATGKNKRLKAAKQDFEALTDIALAGRADGLGMWSQFKSDATDEQLRSNIRVFLAGALEATTSFAGWAFTHLARSPDIQEAIYNEVQPMDLYDPDNLAQASCLLQSLQETLRLTPSLYFLPRRATIDTTVKVSPDKKLIIPKGTHVLLDVWHANRCEDFWGEAVSGYPATEFAPQRWQVLKDKGYSAKDLMHFGFGFGPRTCPGTSLGMLEVGLVVGAFVKMFRFSANTSSVAPKAGVSTKPSDGVSINIEVREPYQ